jgi:hypothetical protein
MNAVVIEEGLLTSAMALDTLVEGDVREPLKKALD